MSRTGIYAARPCPCGHKNCRAWHVAPVADIQGVSFTEEQARAVADLLNQMGGNMTEFEMLLACYRSGQVSERQWQEHLRDRKFREWVENQNPINCPGTCSGRNNPGQEGGDRNA